MIRFAVSGCVVLAALLVCRPSFAADPEPLWKINLAEGKKTPGLGQWVGFTPDGGSLCIQAGYHTDRKSILPFTSEFFSVWDLATRKEKFWLDLAKSRRSLLYNTGPTFAFPSRDTVLVVAGDLSLYSLADGKRIKQFRCLPLGEQGLWVTSDGNTHLV